MGERRRGRIFYEISRRASAARLFLRATITATSITGGASFALTRNDSRCFIVAARRVPLYLGLDDVIDDAGLPGADVALRWGGNVA